MTCVKPLLVAVLMLVMTNAALAQQPTAKSENSSRYRTILTIAGAGGGFTLGVFAGIAKFDDSINSDKKVWTTAIVGGAGGGIAGYFVGRALDKRRDQSNQRSTLRKVDVFPLLSKDTKGLQLSVSF